MGTVVNGVYVLIYSVLICIIYITHIHIYTSNKTPYALTVEFVGGVLRTKEIVGPLFITRVHVGARLY